MDSSELHKKIMLEYGIRPDVKLWRNNVGQLETREGGYVRFGVCNPGGSDIIGLRSILITPEMVNERVAVFVGLEAKMGTGRATKDQDNFRRVVSELGGLAGVARSVRDAGDILFPKLLFK